MRFYEYVRQFYHKGEPRHISVPETSSIRVLKHEEYAAMSAQQVQTLLREKHILITGEPTTPIAFDGPGLRTLAPLSSTVDIQGQSGFSFQSTTL
jgi:hypothetical protein